jgi:hypothetical protein
MKRTEPSWDLLQRGDLYTPAAHTDIRKRFAALKPPPTVGPAYSERDAYQAAEYEAYRQMMTADEGRQAPD